MIKSLLRRRIGVNSKTGGFTSRLFLYLQAAALSATIPSVSAATYDGDAHGAADCSAYFFMAANVKGMAEFNNYYRSGEYAYNLAVRVLGQTDALARFNSTSNEINDLIERNWGAFGRAEERYGVICADLYRDANNPDR